MSYFNTNENAVQSTPISTPIEINRVMKFVYVWMGFGLLTTALVAWVVATNDALLSLAASPVIGIVSFIVLIGIAFGMSAGMNAKWMTPNIAAGMFFTFAALMGFSLSITLFAFLSPTVTNSVGAEVANPMYDPGALYGAFGTAAGLFGAMSLIGFTTKMDLTKMGTFLFMALIGLLIAMVINIFIGSSTLGFIISVGGVIIFTGLTAYDTQKIKEMSIQVDASGDNNAAMKFSIVGALTLYLDFINLFIFLLQIFAFSRD